MPPLKKFKKKHKGLHKILAFFCIVGLFWGGWRVFDTVAGGEDFRYSVAGFIVIAASLTFLYLDDFHLKELE